MNNNKNENKALKVFKERVELIKRNIIDNLKLEMKLMKDSKKPKNENDKAAILDKMRKARASIECYRRALDDLTYAYIDAYRDKAERIYTRFGYKTAEGYLKDKEIGQMPKLATMIELITNHFIEIPQFYSFGYDYDKGGKVVNRNYKLIGHNEYYQSNVRNSGPKLLSNPSLSVKDTMIVEDAAKSGSRHK